MPSWVSDSLTICFAHTKPDTAVGSDDAYVRHIYANSKDPCVYAILSLARYLHANPRDETGPLFSGNSQYDRFQKLLVRVVAKQDEIHSLGMNPDEIGLHSIRKGAA
jgi:hypothetical protein